MENPKKHHILSWFACHFSKWPHFPKVWWIFWHNKPSFIKSHGHGMTWSFKLSHQEARWGNNCPSYEQYCETCHLPWKSLKNPFLCLKCKISQLFGALDFFGWHHWKAEITSFPNIYNTYRFSVKIRQLYPGEKGKVWKIGNVNKIRRRQKNQVWLYF